jgi:acyl-CoA reductase-like NAD-dependent aldehyde dehydrogenase
MSTRSVNPATGEVLETFEDTAEIERILGHAWEAFLQWRRYPRSERTTRMGKVARLLRGHNAQTVGSSLSKCANGL